MRRFVVFLEDQEGRKDQWEGVADNVTHAEDMAHFQKGGQWDAVDVQEIEDESPLHVHPTYSNCATCDGGGCGDCI